MLLAVLALLAALGAVLNVLGTLISVNTFFFTAAAAFLAGFVVVSYGMRAGTLYFFVCLSLDFLLNPNKLHFFLYMALAGYILLAEGSFRVLEHRSQAGDAARRTETRKSSFVLEHGSLDGGSAKKKMRLHRGIRLVLFFALYLPVLLWMPGLLLEGSRWANFLESAWFLPVMAVAGIPLWLVYDLAYFVAKKWFYARFGRLFPRGK